MRAHLAQMFQAGIDACHPRKVLPAHLPDVERPLVLAVGKAAGEMAKVAETHYPDATGIAVVPHGVEAVLERIALLHAGHPVPDAASVAAAERLLAARGGFVLVLLSGGASALACLPGQGLTLAGKQALIAALLRSGAPIQKINCVRRHASRIKGGRLRANLTLAISDVIGDAPENIGSGPTVADPTTVADARGILDHYGLDAPLAETAKRVDGEFRIVASGKDALDAAAREARRLGYAPVLLGEWTGEARHIGRRHAEAALASPPGSALISGGELTVTVRERGRGGPNIEYALAAGLALAGRPGIIGLAADTDGLDGTSGAAGAWFGGGAPPAGAAEALARNDGAAVAELFVTGPTGTNVNDLRIILVGS
ncbi:MAG: glycerate 2-kinase [Sphingomonadales bacterium]|nr:glycerate 2-kinase [Sphingomonadales bacterium]